MEENKVEETIEIVEEETKVPVKKESRETGLWKPKTTLGKKVKDGSITDISDILDKGLKILEPEIVDALMPDIEKELLLIGQSKGKFGGGQRRIFRQTQKKTKDGNVPKFTTIAVVGNRNGYVGIGAGKSKETVPAREKAFKKAKLNIIKIRRGCGSWECGCRESHTVPFKVTGRCGSVTIDLFPAPKGKGLIIQKECAKILKLAGYKDVWSKTKGMTSSTMNLIEACKKALEKLMDTKVNHKFDQPLGVVEGSNK